MAAATARAPVVHDGAVLGVVREVGFEDELRRERRAVALGQTREVHHLPHQAALLLERGGSLDEEPALGHRHREGTRHGKSARGLDPRLLVPASGLSRII